VTEIEIGIETGTGAMTGEGENDHERWSSNENELVPERWSSNANVSGIATHIQEDPTVTTGTVTTDTAALPTDMVVMAAVDLLGALQSRSAIARA